MRADPRIDETRSSTQASGEFGFAATYLIILRTLAWGGVAMALVYSVLVIIPGNWEAFVDGLQMLVAFLLAIVLYDVGRAIFSIHATLKQIAADVAELRAQRRS